MPLVVGLGNPGDRYRDTRHNVGFMVVDALREQCVRGRILREDAWWALEATLAGHPVVLLKPLTFMNLSGTAVAAAMERFGAGADDLLVVLDDVALPPGRVRVRARGGHGGHNGLRSVSEQIGTTEFARVRVGVGSGEPGEDLAAYVLSPIPERDILSVRRAIGRAGEAVVAVLRDGVGAAMNRFNREDEPAAPGTAGPEEH